MGSSVLEASDLSVLGLDVADRVEDEVDEPEGTPRPSRGHVTERDGDAVTAWLGSELGHHVG